MDALVMAGGRGTRLDADAEKPLLHIDGVPMIDRVLDALSESRIEEVYVAPSPATPGTRAHVDVPIVETPGDGYVTDLEVALTDDRLSELVLTVVADLPLLDSAIVDRVIAAHSGGALTAAVPVALKDELGVSIDATLPEDDRWAPSGLNVVEPGIERTYRSWDPRLAVNVNRPSDARVAEALTPPRKN